MTLRLAEEVTFLNKGAILKEFSLIPANSHVIIDRSACVSIDQDVLEIISDFQNTASGRGITVQFVEAATSRQRPLADPVLPGLTPAT